MNRRDLFPKCAGAAQSDFDATWKMLWFLQKMFQSMEISFEWTLEPKTSTFGAENFKSQMVWRKVVQNHLRIFIGSQSFSFEKRQQKFEDLSVDNIHQSNERTSRTRVSSKNNCRLKTTKKTKNLLLTVGTLGYGKWITFKDHASSSKLLHFF